MPSTETTGWFAHDVRDSALVILAIVQFGLLIIGVVSLGHTGWWTSLLLGLASTFLMCTNFQCIAHNFIHNAFFASRRANTVFSLFNSLLIGGSQTLYRFHHLNHHRYNNDLPDPANGKAKDFSSTWQHGDPPVREEPFLKYALLGYFRTDFQKLLATAKKKNLSKLVALEYVALALLIVVLLLTNWQGVIYFYLPVWLLGNIAAVAENYLEHYGATPGDRERDSVSSYGRLYNLVWFNNGYHQEHHLKPQVHWTRVPEVRCALPPEQERRVVNGAHWFNLGPRKVLRDAAPQEKDVRPFATLSSERRSAARRAALLNSSRD
jgi:fatty acid desaturase